jgi:FkbM family methyltransferase
MGFPIIQNNHVRVKPCKHGDFSYNINDTVIGQCLDQYGEYAEAELALASQILRPGAKVIDVGANIGVHSVFYSSVIGNEGEVYAFEPSHLNYFFLMTNLTLNSAFNVTPIKGAVGTKRPLYLPLNRVTDETNHGALKTTDQDTGNEVERCAVFNLDDIQLDYCNLVKIDVEGNEADVLHTGTRLFSTHRPFVIAECQENQKDLLETFKDMDYDCYWLPSPDFNPNNYFENEECIFVDPNGAVINVFAHPKEIDIQIDNLEKITRVTAKWKPAKTTKKAAKTTKKTTKKAKKKKPQ